MDVKRPNFFQQADLNGWSLKCLTYCNSSKVFVLKVDLRYPKELCELHNDYPLAPGKIKIKREVLSNYQF